jgi:hypothetical protein
MAPGLHKAVRLLLCYGVKVDKKIGMVGVTILTGRTLDSAVMTTRAEMYH